MIYRDIDWMSQFLPGQVPDWIMDIEDLNERSEMMTMMGIGTDFDITQSPFIINSNHWCFC